MDQGLSLWVAQTSGKARSLDRHAGLEVIQSDCRLNAFQDLSRRKLTPMGLVQIGRRFGEQIGLITISKGFIRQISYLSSRAALGYEIGGKGECGLNNVVINHLINNTHLERCGCRHGITGDNHWNCRLGTNQSWQSLGSASPWQ